MAVSFTEMVNPAWRVKVRISFAHKKFDMLIRYPVVMSSRWLRVQVWSSGERCSQVTNRWYLNPWGWWRSPHFASDITVIIWGFMLQVRHFDSPYLLYHEKIKTSRVFIRDCSMVSVYPLVLFGGGQVNVQLQKGEFIVSLDDGWIRFAAASHQVRAKWICPMQLKPWMA